MRQDSINQKPKRFSFRTHMGVMIGVIWLGAVLVFVISGW